MELLNPNTKLSIEIKDGSGGEVAPTYLWGGAAAFIRYTPGDILKVYTSPCPCGEK